MITLPKQLLKHEHLLPTLHKLFDAINDAFNSEYAFLFEHILTLSQNVFLNTISTRAFHKLKLKYKHNEMYSTFAKETFNKYESALHSIYFKQHTQLSTAFKKYIASHVGGKCLTKYRRHCAFTDDVAYHKCDDNVTHVNVNVNTMIELIIQVKGKSVVVVVCTICKKCYLSNKIRLWCCYCKCEYYAGLLNDDEDYNVLPAMVTRFHCENDDNDSNNKGIMQMQCVKCKGGLYVNIKGKVVECGNKQCGFQCGVKDVLWKCGKCNCDYICDVKVYNPYEMQFVKESVNRAVEYKKWVFPNKLPCCNGNIHTINNNNNNNNGGNSNSNNNNNAICFYHSKMCNGCLYEGMYCNNKIVTCSKCLCFGYYERFLWTCPLCNSTFRLCDNNTNHNPNSTSTSIKHEIIITNNANNNDYNNNSNNKNNVNVMTPTNHKTSTTAASTLSSFVLDGTCNAVSANKREARYSTFIDIMKNRNYGRGFIQAFHSNALSNNTSLCCVKAPAKRAQSAVKKNCSCDNNKRMKKKGSVTYSQNTSINKYKGNDNNNNSVMIVNVTPCVSKSNNNNDNSLSLGRNSIEKDYMSVPHKIVKRPKKIAINLFKSFHKSEEDNDVCCGNSNIMNNNNNIHLFSSSKVRMMMVNRDMKFNSSFFEQGSSLLNKNSINKSHAVCVNSARSVYYQNSSSNNNNNSISNNNNNINNTNNINNSVNVSNSINNNSVSSNSISDSKNKKSESIRHIYKLKSKYMNATCNYSSNIKAYTNNTNKLLIKDNTTTSITTTTTKPAKQDIQSFINNNNDITQPSSLQDILNTSTIPFFNIDNIKLLTPIGEGSFGKIYSIQDNNTKSKYALKKIIAHDLLEIKRYQNEFELVYSHTHANIMKIYNIQYKSLDFSTFSIYVLMELAECDWNCDIKRKIESKTTYKENELISILTSIVRALAFLQRNNIAHRDIKPQNILLYPNGVVKVADFGEAKEIKIAKRQNTLKGTEMYMSPLLYNAVKYGYNNVEHNVYKSDVFSLGFCVLYAASLNFKVISDLREVNDMNVMKVKIGKYLNKRYSAKFTKAVIKMVEVNEKERVDFVEMEKYIKSNLT